MPSVFTTLSSSAIGKPESIKPGTRRAHFVGACVRWQVVRRTSSTTVALVSLPTVGPFVQLRCAGVRCGWHQLLSWLGVARCKTGCCPKMSRFVDGQSACGKRHVSAPPSMRTRNPLSKLCTATSHQAIAHVEEASNDKQWSRGVESHTKAWHGHGGTCLPKTSFVFPTRKQTSGGRPPRISTRQARCRYYDASRPGRGWGGLGRGRRKGRELESRPSVSVTGRWKN